MRSRTTRSEEDRKTDAGELEDVKEQHAASRDRTDRALARHRAIVAAFRLAEATVRQQRAR